jgi:hypothetical protein
MYVYRQNREVIQKQIQYPRGTGDRDAGYQYFYDIYISMKLFKGVWQELQELCPITR